MDCGLLLRGTRNVIGGVHVVPGASRSESRLHPPQEELHPHMGSQQTPRSNDTDTGDSSVLFQECQKKELLFARGVFAIPFDFWNHPPKQSSKSLTIPHFQPNFQIRGSVQIWKSKYSKCLYLLNNSVFVSALDMNVICVDGRIVLASK